MVGTRGQVVASDEGEAGQGISLKSSALSRYDQSLLTGCKTTDRIITLLSHPLFGDTSLGSAGLVVDMKNFLSTVSSSRFF